MLENISSITVIARTTVATVYRTSQIAASLPNVSYKSKAFPESLFHQLLPAMVHPDHETRIGAHRIFSVVLVPSSVCPSTSTSSESNGAAELARTLSRTVSVFSSSAALFGKLRYNRSFTKSNVDLVNKGKQANEEQQRNNNSGMLNKIKSTYSRVYSTKGSPVFPTTEGDVNISNKEWDGASLRLSSRQISLLLSSIWAQSISPANMPGNYEAIAHTYSLVMLFSRGKNCSQETLVRSFQLAFSLRNISLLEGGPLPPSRRRSLFTLSISMIVFSSKAFNIIPLIARVKAMVSDKLADPYLRLVDDSKLRAESHNTNIVFGSEDDDSSASKYFSEIETRNDQTRESLVSVILKSLDGSSESHLSSVKEQLMNDFLPDDVCPLGAQIIGAPSSIYQNKRKDDKPAEGPGPLFIIEDDALIDAFESQAKDSSMQSNKTTDLLSVNELLESVLETAQQVGRLSVCMTPDISYMETASHCEALLMGKQEKMSQLRQEISQCRASISYDETEMAYLPPIVGVQGVSNPFLDQNFGPLPMMCAAEHQQYPNPFMLPAANPFDNFLKAAGC
ncbi:hypothetical protein NMG60_11001045 [Bertholletia excelsa]